MTVLISLISGSHPSQQSGDCFLGQNHDQEQDGRDGAGIAHLKPAETVVEQVGNHRTGCVVRGGESAQHPRNVADVERVGDAHYRAEQQHGLHARQGNVVQLLPAVADAVHISGFVHAPINPLEAGDKAQEAGAHAHPQDDNDQDRHHGIRSDQPKLRCFNNAELHQDCVEPPVGIAAEQDGEDRKRGGRDGRGVEDHHRHRADPFRQFIDKPREQEGKDISDRSGNHRDHERVLDCNQEYLILQDQVDVVLEADKPGRFQDVVIRKPVEDRRTDRQDEESKEQDGVRSQKQVAYLVMLCLHQSVLELFALHFNEAGCKRLCLLHA